jgi:hypothetical protein
MRKAFAAILVVMSACGTPGLDLAPQAGDFAFLEVKLKG